MNKVKHYPGGDDRQKFQGDIAIIALGESDCEGVVFSPLEGDRLVIGHSESGHHHVAVKERGAEIEFAKDEHGYFLRIKGGDVQIVHEKEGGHEPQTLSEGLYFFGQKYEYSELEQYRRVAD